MAAPGEYDAEAVAALAKAWIDGVNSATGVSGGWRLQVLRMRTRRRFRGGSAEPGPVLDANGEPVSSTGAASGAGCDEYPVRIRRFVQGCPWALVDAAIRYLHSIAPYTGIVYNGVRLAGSYRPTKTEWLRDGQALVAERQVDATYTLYQDLLEITECDDSLSLASGSSCSAYEETTYRWDADSVEPVPLECEQGVTWSVRAVQRNEDGTFDYQLVKSVARSRHFGPVLVSCDSLSRVTEETWESLYGDPDSGSLHGEGCDFAGSVPLDGACSPVPGVRVQLQWRRNPDCTYDVTRRAAESSPALDSWREGASCRPVDVVQARNARDLPAVPVPVPGESVDRRLTLNEDGTYDYVDTVRRAPDPYSLSWTDGSSCRRRNVEVLGAQPSMPQPPAVPGRGRLEATVRRNDDCTWDARFETVQAPDPFVAEWVEGSACRPERVRVAEGEAAPPSVPEPGPGETVAASVSRDADCTFSSRVTVRSAPSAFSASWGEGTPCRPSETTVYDGWAELPPVPALAKGRTVQASLRRESDCTFSGTVSVATQTGDSKSWREGSSCRPVDVTETWGAETVDIPEAGEGETVSASVQRNPDCTYDVRVRTVRAATGDAGSWTEGTPCRPVETTIYDSVAGMPGVPALEAGKTVQANFRRNDDCTYSGTVSVATQTGDSRSWVEGSCCQPTYVTMSTGLVELPPESSSAPRCGTVVSQRVSRNSDCTYDVMREVMEPEDDFQEYEWVSGDRHVRFVQYFNRPAPYIIHSPSCAGGVVNNDFHRNSACLYDGTASEICPLEDSASHADGYTWGPNISDAVAMEYHVTPGQDRQQLGFHWTVKVGWSVEGAQKLKAYSSMRANWAAGGGGGFAIEGLSTHGGYGRDEIMFSFMAVKVVQTDLISRNLRGSQLTEAINDYVKGHVVGPTKGGLGT